MEKNYHAPEIKTFLIRECATPLCQSTLYGTANDYGDDGAAGNSISNGDIINGGSF